MLIKPKNVKLKNGLTVTIRSPLPKDAESLLRNLQTVSHESYRNMNQPAAHWDAFPVDEERKIIAGFGSSDSKFMVSAFFQGRVVGNLGIVCSAGSFLRHNARLGMGIEKAFCGVGAGSALIAAALAQCRKIKLRRVELSVRTFNKPGIALYEKSGFKRVGLLKKAAFIDGRYRDEYLYQILL